MASAPASTLASSHTEQRHKRDTKQLQVKQRQLLWQANFKRISTNTQPQVLNFGEYIVSIYAKDMNDASSCAAF